MVPDQLFIQCWLDCLIHLRIVRRICRRHRWSLAVINRHLLENRPRDERLTLQATFLALSWLGIGRNDRRHLPNDQRRGRDIVAWNRRCRLDDDYACRRCHRRPSLHVRKPRSDLSARLRLGVHRNQFRVG